MSTSTKLEERRNKPHALSKFNVLYFENHNILNTFIKTICPVTGKYKCKCYNNFRKNIQKFIVLKRDVFACYLHFNNVIIVKMEAKAGQFYSKQNFYQIIGTILETSFLPKTLNLLLSTMNVKINLNCKVFNEMSISYYNSVS